MNWLTQYQVCINCVTREVTLTSQEGRAIKFYARKGIPKGEMVFTTVAKEMDLIHVASEFLDVFPEELPGMPPERERLSLHLILYLGLHRCTKSIIGCLPPNLWN